MYYATCEMCKKTLLDSLKLLICIITRRCDVQTDIFIKNVVHIESYTTDL